MRNEKESPGFNHGEIVNSGNSNLRIWVYNLDFDETDSYFVFPVVKFVANRI
jgi:hypothetical protein